MTFEIHPSAEDNFNQKARSIIDIVKIFPIVKRNNEVFPSDIHVSVILEEKDILGPIEETASDFLGNTVARFFRHEDTKYGIDGDDYKKLLVLAEQIQKLKPIKNKLSTKYIESLIFKWVSREYIKDEKTMEFISYLKESASKDIKTITSWIPIANLEIERPFRISYSEVRSLSKATIEEWKGSLLKGGLDHNEKLIKLFDQISNDYQGLAAVVTKIDAEPIRAYEIAQEEAVHATAILGVFSKAVLIPQVKCASKVKGSENISQITCFQLSGLESFSMLSEITDKSADLQWRLRNKDIEELESMVLNKINPIILSQAPSEFYKSIANSVYIYSKAAFTADPLEKVIYMLSALESILLKNENEPIQQNLAERIAFFISNNIDGRKKIIRNIKDVYGIRSKYLHHGYSSYELESISEFMLNTQVVIVGLLLNADRFVDKSAFINAIEDIKFR